MKKFKGLRAAALLLTSASALTACGPQKGIVFWSSFGAAYTEVLKKLCNKVQKQTGVEFKHVSQGSYEGILKQMRTAINGRQHPTLAVGYPDHIVSYLGKKVLVPLDDELTTKEKEDYYKTYLDENKFYDNSGKGTQHLYGVPFNKSTELLGYNGVFVDYCATIDSEHCGRDKLPETWQEWRDNGHYYMDIYNDLVSNHSTIYGRTGEKGYYTDLSTTKGDRSKLLSFVDVEEGTNYLMAYDSTDNAFITFVKLWGAQYTELDPDTIKMPVNRRVGNVKFTNNTNKAKVKEMFSFFYNLYQNRLFTTPATFQTAYASTPFEENKVMFMICSSGGLNYNTTIKEKRFSVAPVPYFKDSSAERKYVIAQGANICVTDNGDTKKAVKVLKALTTADIQAEWCVTTGYFPGSKSAANTTRYKNFLKSTDYSNPTATAYREGAAINTTIYNGEGSTWNNFVDAAFDGSADLRENLKPILKQVFVSDGSDAAFNKILKDLKETPDLAIDTINFE